jgi:hypothetical protein
MEVATTKVSIYYIDAFTLRTDDARSKHELFQLFDQPSFQHVLTGGTRTMSVGIHQFLRSLTGTSQPEARACMSSLRLAVNVRMKMRQAKKLKDKSEGQYQDASR